MCSYRYVATTLIFIAIYILALWGISTYVAITMIMYMHGFNCAYSIYVANSCKSDTYTYLHMYTHAIIRL